MGTTARRKLAWRKAVLVFCSVLLVAAAAVGQPTFIVLHQFDGNDGWFPNGGLASDASGTVYGASQYGGIGQCAPLPSPVGCGLVFSIDSHGNETFVYRFSGPDGAAPMAGVFLDGAGSVWGTTAFGGDPTCQTGFDIPGCGVVFRINLTTGREWTRNFTGPDGMLPRAGVVADSAGNVYGTTYNGGAYTYYGVVFKILPVNGALTVLYDFSGGADGAWPAGTLVLDDVGNIYGTTTGGGNSSGCNGYGCGVVFKLDPNGGETVLYTFTGGTDGAVPGGKLFRDGLGNLYGTTLSGGDDTDCPPQGNEQLPGCGVVFKLDPSGNETVLYTFKGETDGGSPQGVVQDSLGNLYGVTLSGGNSRDPCGPTGCGTVFKLGPDGTKTALHNFAGVDGSVPSGDLLQDTSGDLYGVTVHGALQDCNNTGCGNVFKMSSSASDFTISASPLSPGSVNAGGSATATITIAAVAGFTGSVALACSVSPLPALAPQCAINPNSANPGTAATLTVTTVGSSSALRDFRHEGWLYAAWIPLLGVVTWKVGVSADNRGVRRRIWAVALVPLSLTGFLVVSGCGGGSNNNGGGSGNGGTPTGTYNITITGSSGSLQHVVTATLNVV